MKTFVTMGLLAVGSIAHAETVALFETTGEYSASSFLGVSSVSLDGVYDLFIGDPANYGYDSYTLTASLSLDGTEIVDETMAMDFDPSAALTTADTLMTAVFALPGVFLAPGVGATFTLSGAYALDTDVMGDYDATITGSLPALLAAVALGAGVDLPTLPTLPVLDGDGYYALKVELTKEDVGQVPLPASGLLILAGLGGLAVARRSKG